MRRNKSDRAIVSLDIGSDSIKMVKGMRSGDKICVLDFAHRKYPASEVTPDLVSQDIYELLTSVVDEKEIKRVRIHSTISGRKLCIRVVKLPVMPEAELHQTIRSKIRKYVSPDLDQVVFSFSVLGDIQEKDIKKLEVVFAAIQKTFFNEYLQFFKLAAVVPEVITSSCFSGWHLIRETGLDKGISSVMLINIESQETDLTVYRKERFVFTRNISIGGRDFTDKLKGQTQLSLQKPEVIKLLWGLEEQEPAAEATEQANLMKIRELLQSEANVLCKEIELTAHHYYQIMHGRRIDKCIILGEGSRIGGLVDFLKQKLEIPVEGLHIPDAKLDLTIDKREEFKRNLPLYTQALGAILVGPEDINLLAKAGPQAKRGIHPVKFFAHPKLTSVAAISFISLVLIAFTFLKGINLYYQHQIKSYNIKRDKLQSQTAQLMQIKRKTDILDFEKSLYLRVIKEHPAYPVIIAEICQAIPSERIVLDELKFSVEQKRARSPKALSPIKFTIAGRVLGRDPTGSEATRFVLALERSGHFENISITIEGKARDRVAARESPEAKLRELSFVINGVVGRDKIET